MSTIAAFIEAYPCKLVLKWQAGDPVDHGMLARLQNPYPKAAHWVASVEGGSDSAEGATPDDAVQALAKWLVRRLEVSAEIFSSKSVEQAGQAAALKDVLLTSAAGQP